MFLFGDMFGGMMKMWSVRRPGLACRMMVTSGPPGGYGCIEQRDGLAEVDAE